jgi:hypothetical protein
VHDLFAFALAVQTAGVAGDTEDLGGAGEVDPGGGRDLDEALLGAPVAAGSGAAGRRPLGVTRSRIAVRRPGWLAFTVSRYPARAEVQQRGVQGLAVGQAAHMAPC